MVIKQASNDTLIKHFVALSFERLAMGYYGSPFNPQFDCDCDRVILEHGMHSCSNRNGLV